MPHLDIHEPRLHSPDFCEHSDLLISRQHGLLLSASNTLGLLYLTGPKSSTFLLEISSRSLQTVCSGNHSHTLSVVSVAFLVAVIKYLSRSIEKRKTLSWLRVKGILSVTAGKA